MKIAKIQNNFKINNQVKPCSKQAAKQGAPLGKVSFCGNFDSYAYLTGVAEPFFLAAISKIEPDKENIKEYFELACVGGKYSPKRALTLLNIYGMQKDINDKALHEAQEYKNSDKETQAKFDKRSNQDALEIASYALTLCSKPFYEEVDTSNLHAALNVARVAQKKLNMSIFAFSLICRDAEGNFSPQIAMGIFDLMDKTGSEDSFLISSIVNDYCLTPEYTLDKNALDIAADIYNAWGEDNADEFIDLVLNLREDKMDSSLAKITVDMLKYFDDCDCDIEQIEEEMKPAEEDGFDEENWRTDYQAGDDFGGSFLGGDMWHTVYQAGDDIDNEIEDAPRFYDDFCDHEEIENDDMDFEELFEDEEAFEEDEEQDCDNIKLNDDYVATACDSIKKMMYLVRDHETGEVDLARFEEIFEQIKEDSHNNFNEFTRIIREEY